MTTWYESAVDRQIRQAQESGQFDDLPGLGKPLPGHNQDYDEDWWLKDLVRREDITGVLPESLALRREAEDLIERISKKSSEHAVRRTVDELNARILRARRGSAAGPPVVLRTIDVDEAVRTWRRLRAPGPDR